jgi:hypothetical protein
VPRARKRKLYELLRTIVPTHITKEDTSVAAYGVRNMYGRAAHVHRVPSWMQHWSAMNWNTGHARAGKPGPASAGTFAGTAGANQTSKTITELNDIMRRGINDASYGSLFRFGKRGLLFIKIFSTWEITILANLSWIRFTNFVRNKTCEELLGAS